MQPPPHFKPFDSTLPVKIYRQSLPHWRQDGATYFVTFRLHDSIPPKIAKKLNEVRQNTQNESDDESARAWFQLYDASLDEGAGECLLKFPENREALAETLRYFSDTGERVVNREAKARDLRYRLGAFVIMPNHVHLIIQPTNPNRYPLENLLRSIKSFSARAINSAAGKAGQPIWQDESHDRIVREVTHLKKALQYIGRNPDKAGLGTVHTTRWVNPLWRASGWDFRGNLQRRDH